MTKELSGELEYRIRYDVEHDLFHAQNIFSEEYITPTFIEYVQKLEKENAELKGLKDVATLIKANNDTVVTLMQLNNMLVSKSQQLTIAKDLIHQFLIQNPISDWLPKKAEQFLKGENIILEDAQNGNSPFDADEVFNKEMKAYSDEK